MRIWIVNNLDTGHTAAFATNEEAKEAMRAASALWALRQVEASESREGACLLYNRRLPPESVLAEFEYESRNGRLVERK